MENLDNIKVTVIEKNAVTVTASQQMISFPTLVGPVGPVGPQGPAGPSGQGAWGTITGDISEQTDLQDALNLKANTADLGEMATVNDAPSNDQEYVRKNGNWAVSSGGGGGGDAVWGGITGTLSNQTDLQSALDAKQNTLTFDTTPTAASTNPVTSGGIKTALDAKANSADLGDLASQDQVAWSTDISGIPSTFPPSTHNHDDRYYTETEVDTALGVKANLASPAFTGTPTAPTAGVGTNNTQLATTAFVVSHDVFKITGTVSASNYTLTDSRINNEHWEVDTIYFETPANVTSKVHWVTDITNHQVSLGATHAGSTNVVVKMHWVQ